MNDKILEKMVASGTFSLACDDYMKFSLMCEYLFMLIVFS